MYTIHIDGQLLWSSAQTDEEYAILNPKLTLDVNSAGALSFTLPPCNGMHDSIRRLKSIVTVEQDGEVIFRGRVMDDEKDFYNQKNVYCEGERSFLLDSLKKPYTYSGNIQAFFRSLIGNHNAQVDEEKRFTVGTITAVSADATMALEETAYTDTASVIENKLLNAYGGYIRTRPAGNGCYIDWLATPGDDTAQAIAFSVNLLDIKDKVDAGDVFTCLIPLGASQIGDDGEYGDPVGIASVNGGIDYIADDDAVALYGKIWKAQTWPNEKDPAQLLIKGREFLKTGAAVQTLTLKAIDMHFADSDVQSIRIGDGVRILSDPHGLDMKKHCVKMDVDLLKPEETAYTFGEAPRTLTENTIRAKEDIGSLTGSSGRGGGGSGRSIQEEAQDILRWAKIVVDEANANISLNAGMIDKTQQYMSAAGINIDGELAQVKILATKEVTDALTGRVSAAESSISVNADNIELKVSKDGVISSINQSAESVTIKASKINLSGYVTASEFSALEAQVGSMWNGLLEASAIWTQNLTATNTVRLCGHTCEWKSVTVLTSNTSLSITSTGGTVTGVKLNKKTETIDYLGT